MTIQSEIDDTVRLCLRNRHRMALNGTAELSWYAGAHLPNLRSSKLAYCTHTLLSHAKLRTGKTLVSCLRMPLGSGEREQSGDYQVIIKR